MIDEWIQGYKEKKRIFLLIFEQTNLRAGLYTLARRQLQNMGVWELKRAIDLLLNAVPDQDRQLVLELRRTILKQPYAKQIAAIDAFRSRLQDEKLLAHLDAIRQAVILREALRGCTAKLELDAAQFERAIEDAKSIVENQAPELLQENIDDNDKGVKAIIIFVNDVLDLAELLPQCMYIDFRDRFGRAFKKLAECLINSKYESPTDTEAVLAKEKYPPAIKWYIRSLQAVWYSNLLIWTVVIGYLVYSVATPSSGSLTAGDLPDLFVVSAVLFGLFGVFMYVGRRLPDQIHWRSFDIWTLQVILAISLFGSLLFLAMFLSDELNDDIESLSGRAENVAWLILLPSFFLSLLAIPFISSMLYFIGSRPLYHWAGPRSDVAWPRGKSPGTRQLVEGIITLLILSTVVFWPLLLFLGRSKESGYLLLRAARRYRRHNKTAKEIRKQPSPKRIYLDYAPQDWMVVKQISNAVAQFQHVLVEDRKDANYVFTIVSTHNPDPAITDDGHVIVILLDGQEIDFDFNPILKRHALDFQRGYQHTAVQKVMEYLGDITTHLPDIFPEQPRNKIGDPVLVTSDVPASSSHRRSVAPVVAPQGTIPAMKKVAAGARQQVHKAQGKIGEARIKTVQTMAVAPEPGSVSQERLQELFFFTEKDLKANRRLRLSIKQIRDILLLCVAIVAILLLISLIAAQVYAPFGMMMLVVAFILPLMLIGNVYQVNSYIGQIEIPDPDTPYIKLAGKEYSYRSSIPELLKSESAEIWEMLKNPVRFFLPSVRTAQGEWKWSRLLKEQDSVHSLTKKEKMLWNCVCEQEFRGLYRLYTNGGFILSIEPVTAEELDLQPTNQQ